jgi:hypothetical protein
MERSMAQKTTRDPEHPQTKTTERQKPQAELDERELDKVSGGTCASGRHLPEVTIKP